MTPPTSSHQIVLASASRARREMLAAAGVAFTVEPADVDEPTIRDKLRIHDEPIRYEFGSGWDRVRKPGEPVRFVVGDQPYHTETYNPRYIAVVLAQAKAKNVSARHPEALVIGADQILSFGPGLLTKAKNEADARATLSNLRGQEHELHSAVAIAQGGEVNWTHVDTAYLTMRDFSDAFLDEYLRRAGERVLQSVGAYEFEGLGVQLFDRIEGDYFTILGMPLLPLLGELRARGCITQ
jgi:septum formation protein